MMQSTATTIARLREATPEDHPLSHLGAPEIGEAVTRFCHASADLAEAVHAAKDESGDPLPAYAALGAIFQSFGDYLQGAAIPDLAEALVQP